MNQAVEKIKSEVSRVIRGKDEVIGKVLMAMLSGGHILLEDVPGTGKTTLALAFSKALGLDYKRIQFTTDTVPSDVIGFSVFNRETGVFDYVKGAVMCNLLLADEINRTSPKTQSALLEVMEEGQVTVDGRQNPVPKPFTVIATQNPVGSAGTQLLPQAQLDRFMVRLSMGYPDFDDEVNILKDRHQENPLEHVRQAADAEGFLAMQREAAAVHVADVVYEYVTNLARATRSHQMITLGLSARGSLAVCRMAKAYAYTAGRDYVVPEDVAAVFADVAVHRIVLSPRAKMTETAALSVMEDIIGLVNMPVGRGV